MSSLSPFFREVEAEEIGLGVVKLDVSRRVDSEGGAAMKINQKRRGQISYHLYI